jgi:8-oxo-dGTP diphosphatase
VSRAIESARTPIAAAIIEMIDGTAHVAADNEMAEVAWCDRATLAAKVPHRFHGPVQAHLDAGLR